MINYLYFISKRSVSLFVFFFHFRVMTSRSSKCQKSWAHIEKTLCLNILFKQAKVHFLCTGIDQYLKLSPLTFENTVFHQFPVCTLVFFLLKAFFLCALIDFPTGLLSSSSRWPEIPTFERSKARSMVKVTSGSLFTLKLQSHLVS